MVFMIAVIEDNNNNVIGVRLLNSKSRQIIDVTLADAIFGIANGTKVENIDIVDGKIVGTNGSLERYTKIDSNNNVISGKTPFIVLNRITNNNKNIGVTIVDYMGNISTLSNKDSVLHANKKGIGVANGKVHSGLLTSINGAYATMELPMEHIKYTKSPKEQPEIATKYTGELIGGPLKPLTEYDVVEEIMITSVCSNKEIEVERHMNKEGSIVDYKSIKSNKYGLIEDTNYTLLNDIQEKIDVVNNKDDVKHLLRSEENRKIVDEAIEGIKVGQKRIVVEFNPDNRSNDISEGDALIEKYYNTIKDNGIEIYTWYRWGTHLNIIAYRSVDDDGIKYYTMTKEFADDQFAYAGDVTLEEIYIKRDIYDNLRETEKGIAILGFDGEYEYDMDIIHNTYNKKVITNETERKKAAVLGHDKIEDISSDGKLIAYKSSYNDVIDLTKPSILAIGRGSIELTKANRKIIFGKQLKSVSSGIIVDPYSGDNKIREIDIHCSGSAAAYAIKMTRIFRQGILLNFHRDITVKELLMVMDYSMQNGGHYNHTVKANNIDTRDNIWGNKIIVESMKEILRLIELRVNHVNDNHDLYHNDEYLINEAIAEYLRGLQVYWVNVFRKRCGDNKIKSEIDSIVKKYVSSKEG